MEEIKETLNNFGDGAKKYACIVFASFLNLCKKNVKKCEEIEKRDIKNVK